MSAPKVSIMFLSWNSAGEILDGVRSALDQTASQIEVMVLDNASEDRTPEIVAEEFGTRIRVIQFEDNLGYTGGYNRGFRLAQGEFCLVVNPDVRLEPDYVERALAGFDDPRVGIVAGRLLREGKQAVDSTGQFLARSRKTIDRGYGQTLDSGQEQSGPVLAACGAAAFYRREMIEDISDGDDFFDPLYFAFHEDLEVGWRAWRAGWTAVYRPDAVAVHLRAGGRKAGRLGLTFKRSAAVTAHIVKNRYLSMIRHDALGAVLWDLPWILARDLKLLAALVVFRPSVIRELWVHREAFREMWRRRKADRTRKGVWGGWRKTLPRRGVWLITEPGVPGRS